MKIKALLALLLLLCSSCGVAHAQELNSSSTIYFETEVTDESVNTFIDQLSQAEQSNKDITVVISSPGGSVMAGWRMTHAIERSPAHITCRAEGMVASMAAIVFEDCDERVMTKDSVLMFHSVGMAVQGQDRQLENALRLAKALNFATAQIVVAQSHLSVEEYLAMIEGGKEVWMNFPEALYLGLVDEVE